MMRWALKEALSEENQTLVWYLLLLLTMVLIEIESIIKYYFFECTSIWTSIIKRLWKARGHSDRQISSCNLVVRPYCSSALSVTCPFIIILKQHPENTGIHCFPKILSAPPSHFEIVASHFPCQMNFVCVSEWMCIRCF